MQESLYQTANVGDTLSDSRCRRLTIRQRMQETLYHAADAGVILSDRKCRRLYQIADAGVSPFDSG